MECKTSAGFGTGLLIGAIIGGVVALLYAPKSGKKTRKFLKNKASEVVDEVKEEGGEVVDEVKEEAGEVVDAVKEETSEVIDMVKEATSESSRKGKAVVKAIKS
jgi:gas vesicle protein